MSTKIGSLDKLKNEYKVGLSLNKLKETEIILTLREYSSLCSDNSFWELEDYEKRKAAYNELKQKKKKIKQLLNSLIPKGATNKKGNPHTRKLRFFPEVLWWCVESRKQKLNPLMKEYKKKHPNLNKENRIKKILKNELNIDKPNNIYIDDRTEATIALSIIAHYIGSSFSTLYPIYNSIDIEKRKDILKNPNKYITSLSQPWFQ